MLIMPTNRTIDIHTGPVLSVVAVINATERCAAKEYIDQLQPRDRGKFKQYFNRVCNGARLSKDKFRYLDHGIYEFKTWTGHRLFGFHTSDKRFVLTNGYKKDGDALSQHDFEKAIEVKTAFERGG